VEASARAVAEAPYHGLWTMPFHENTDPRFLWLGPPYRDAFAILRAGVLENAGLLVLTGEVGTGKTMLASALADSLRTEGVRVDRLSQAALHQDEFRAVVARAFALAAVPPTREALVAGVAEVLAGAYARGEKMLLVIDEAQNLDDDVLDDIDGLIRAGREAGKGDVNVLDVLLVGQAEMEARLRRRAPGGREGAVAVRARLRALDRRQVGLYVACRLRVAGARRSLFSADAIREIATVSEGVPRVINRICDSALLLASRRNERLVSARLVRDAVGEFGLSPARRARGGAWGIAVAAALVLALGAGAALYRGGIVFDAASRADRGADAAPPADTAMRPAAPATPAAETVVPAAPVGRAVAQPEAVSPAPAGTVAVSPALRDTPRAEKPPLEASRLKPVVPAGRAVAAPAMVSTPEPTPASKADDPDDASAIITWMLQRSRPPGER
jgi:general secretion pathway protein A